MRSPTELAPLLQNSRGAVFRIPGTRRTGETANGRVGAAGDRERNADAEAFWVRLCPVELRFLLGVSVVY